jgi:hypothetical protein
MSTARIQFVGRFWHLVLPVFCTMMLASCGVVIIQTPATDSRVSSPVAVNLKWTADMQPGTSLEVALDGSDIASHFHVNPDRTANDTIIMNPGPHTLVAGGYIYCWYCVGGSYSHTSSTVHFTVVPPSGPSLSLSPDPIIVDADNSSNGMVTLDPPSSASVSITLMPQGSASFQINSSSAGQSVQVNVPANQQNASFTVTGIGAGTGTIHASATGFSSSAATIHVRPVITSINPNPASGGSTVTVQGHGFMQGAAVHFGQTSASTSVLSATELTTVVPSNLSGTQSVTVVAGGQTSNAIAFSIGVASPSPVVFRSSVSDVQSFNFTSPGSPSSISTQSTVSSPGVMVIGLSFSGAVLVRSSSSGIQTFSVNTAGQLAPGSSVSATLSPVGAAVAVTSNQIIRASASAMEIFSLTGTTPSLQGSISATSSPTGTGIAFAVVSGQPLAVRGYSSGVETFNITNPASVTLRGMNSSGGLSSTGVDLCVVGSTAVRAYSNGIEVYDLTPTVPNRTASDHSGALSGNGVGVASNAQLSRIVRATDKGIEVYQLTGTTLTMLGSKNGTLSPTGVAVTMTGNRVFRAHANGVEEYDISNPSDITLVSNTSATSSSTGVGIAVR